MEFLKHVSTNQKVLELHGGNRIVDVKGCVLLVLKLKQKIEGAFYSVKERKLEKTRLEP